MLIVNSNGSNWAGATPDLIAAFEQRLASTPLDPSFESFGNFIVPAKNGQFERCYTTPGGYKLDAQGERVVVNEQPIYPDAPDAVRIWGNFMEVSAVFCIDTDEPEVIDRLTKAIRANQATPAYQAYKAA